MKDNDVYFRKVEREIREGTYQEGLVARAIADTDGDENKARALYIKLRIESLKAVDNLVEREAVEEIRKAKEQQLKVKKQERLAQLNIELENLSPVSRRRKIVAIVAICGGFIIGIVIGILSVVFGKDNGSKELLSLVLALGGLFAFFGYGVAIIYRNFSPTQRYLYKIKNEIRDLNISPTRRLVRRWGWNLFFGVWLLILLLRLLGLIRN